ncbi:MAG: tetratricopeptide repeat protein [Deltaproteobacteria bacterium]|nr:tetratricopeptide repeat protein [Deltaproteobacteria bacterium]
MKRSLLPLFVAPFCLGWAVSEPGLPTGQSHMVQVTSSPTAGLEAGIPRRGWYAKGIDLDLQGRWEESYAAYQKAREEFVEWRRQRPRWAKMIDGWLMKCDYQLEQSSRLRYRPYHTSWRYPSSAASNYYYRATAKHNKWLAIRAFTGQAHRKLMQEVLEDYQAALKQYPTHQSARLALATAYHEAGQAKRAVQELQKVPRPIPRWLALQEAYYHTAAGQVDRAFALLSDAMAYSSSSRLHILRSNDFDRLRADPRFRRLVGEP